MLWILWMACWTMQMVESQAESGATITSANEILQWKNLTTYLALEDEVVTHLEPDLYAPGNILYSTYRSLKTTDGTHTTIIAGNDQEPGHFNDVGTRARFEKINDFLQLNSQQVVVLDKDNHCLRVVDRTTQSVSSYAGSISSNESALSFVDGKVSVASFAYPERILIDHRNTHHILVLDPGNRRLRLVDMLTQIVSTVVKLNELSNAKHMMWDIGEHCNSLIVLCEHMVARFTFSDLQLTPITQVVDAGFKDGHISEAEFGLLTDAVVLKENVYIVADRANGKLRYVDISNDTVVSICTDEQTLDTGVSSNCQFQSPQSLLLLNNTLYISTAKGISALPVELEESKEECPTDMSVELRKFQFSTKMEIIPGHTVKLRRGNHTWTSPDLTCTVQINVIRDTSYDSVVIIAGGVGFALTIVALVVILWMQWIRYRLLKIKPSSNTPERKPGHMALPEHRQSIETDYETPDLHHSMGKSDGRNKDVYDEATSDDESSLYEVVCDLNEIKRLPTSTKEMASHFSNKSEFENESSGITEAASSSNAATTIKPQVREEERVKNNHVAESDGYVNVNHCANEYDLNRSLMHSDEYPYAYADNQKLATIQSGFVEEDTKADTSEKWFPARNPDYLSENGYVEAI